MFITAADIGKFLSEIVIRSYSKLLELIEWAGSVIDAVRDYLKDEDDDSIDSRFISFLLLLVMVPFWRRQVSHTFWWIETKYYSYSSSLKYNLI